MLDKSFGWWFLDGGYEIRLVESGPHISLSTCVLLTPLLWQLLKSNTQFNHGLINISVFGGSIVPKLIPIREAKDF